MNAADLTTVAELADYISPALTGQSLTNATPNFSRIITAVSIGINRYLSRRLAVSSLAEVRNGNGRPSMRTLVYPIVSVASVVVAPIAGAPGTTLLPTNGNQVPSVTWDKWFIYLNGGYFTGAFQSGKQNVTLNYTAGFVTPGMVALQSLPQWPGNSQLVKQGTQMQVNGYVFICRVPGTTQASGMPAFPTPAGGVSPTLPGYVWPQAVQATANPAVFTLSAVPNPASGSQVFLNGLLQQQGVDYTLSGNLLTMTVAPSGEFSLLAGYPTAGTGGVIPTASGSVLNTVVTDGTVIWSCQGLVPIIPAGASWIPEDISLACLQQCALLMKNRTRVGDSGEGLGPDRVNYFLKDAHPSTLSMLTTHREVFPTDGMGIQ